MRPIALLVIAVVSTQASVVQTAEPTEPDLRARIEAGDCDGCNLIEVDLQGVNLRGRTLRFGQVHQVNWSGADLTNATITGNLDGDFTDAKLDGATIHGKVSGKFLRASFIGASVAGGLHGDFTDAKLDGATIQGELSGTSFVGAKLVGAKVAGGLSGNVEKADLTGAKINKIRRLSGSIRESKLDNAHLAYDLCYRSPIENSSLQGATIIGDFVIRFCNISNSDLTGARIDAWFVNESIVGSKLDDARIRLRTGVESPAPSELRISGGSLRNARITGNTNRLTINVPEAERVGLVIQQ